MTPMTAVIAMSVVAPAISISHRTFATMRAAAGSRGASSSAESLLMALQGRSETLVIAAEEVGERLDRVLAHRVAELSRSRHKALILAGRVAIDGATIRDPGHRVNAGATIVLDLPPAEEVALAPETIPPGVGGVKRPGIVHRLDKDTSGLMVVAKTDRAHRALSRQFADHGRNGPLRRGYLAFVWGVPERPRGTIDKPIGRHPRVRDKMAVRAGGRAAVTHWEVLERYRGRDGAPVASLIACRLETGRTHQIRVHLAAIGHPLLGDNVYGAGFKTKAALLPQAARAALEALGRQALHAYLLAIEHPSQGTNLEFRSELPDDLLRLRHSLGAQGTAS